MRKGRFMELLPFYYLQYKDLKSKIIEIFKVGIQGELTVEGGK